MNDSSSMNDSSRSKDSILTAMLAEYSSLRSESLEAIKSRAIITNSMFAIITLVFTAVVSGKITTPYNAIIAIFIAPQFLRAMLWIALGEYHRSQRAGRYLCILERRINQHLSSIPNHEALQWESFLENQKKHMVSSYEITGILALIMIWSSNIFGIYNLYDFCPESIWVIVIVCFIIEIVFFIKTHAAWVKSRRNED